MVGPSVVVEGYPVRDHAGGVLDALEAVAVSALLFQGADQPLHHAVLLRSVRGNELLSQAIAAHQGRVMAGGKNQAIIGP